MFPIEKMFNHIFFVAKSRRHTDTNFLLDENLTILIYIDYTLKNSPTLFDNKKIALHLSAEIFLLIIFL